MYFKVTHLSLLFTVVILHAYADYFVLNCIFQLHKHRMKLMKHKHEEYKPDEQTNGERNAL